MSTPNINCILQAAIAIQNNLISPPPFIGNFDFGNPSLGAKVIFYEPYYQAPAFPTVSTVPLPLVNGVSVLMIQNLSPTAVLNFTFTPNAQPTTNMNMGPQGTFIWIDPSELGVMIVSLTVSGAGGIVPAMILAGG